MIDRETKALYARKAEIIKAVAHPLRVAVVDFLKDGEKCVCEIAEHIGSERSNVSRHLAVMLKAGVLKCRKDGLMVYYELQTPCILNFLNCATQALKHKHNEDVKVMANA
ncbi:MAG: metalloregulator ArsR/SmtB family transcription factor [Phycisphaerae bacterium]